MGVRLSRASATSNGMSSHDDRLGSMWRLRGRESRRQSDHEDGMKDLVRALEGFVPMDEIGYRDLTISDGCLGSLAEGTASEARLAFRAIGLLALTVGARNDEYCFNLVFGIPLAAVRHTMRESSDTATLVAALHCLAALSFAGARRPEDTHESMKAVMAVFSPRPAATEIAETDQRYWSMSPELLEAAVSTWTLLLTTLVGLNTCPYEWEDSRLAELLQSDDLSLRTAAGLVLARWAELILTRHASTKSMQELDDRMPNLAANTKHGQCPDPEEKSTTPKSSRGRREIIKVSTWARLVQLSFLKRFLGNGFDKHVLHNPLVREVATDTVNDHEADELCCDARDGDVHQWHNHGKVVGVIKSWVEWVTKITRMAK